ncbi:hypothetical protein [Micromonospora sp. NPDC023888]|uniref:hypothetical protein n=1 Tax=Micromonospora sp. NPDC023888 TaxID=3155607 RepID=UPI0033C5A7F7
MPGSVDAADGRLPVRSRRRRLWLLSFLAVVGCCFGVLRMRGPVETSAQRHLSQVDVRGYERVRDYIDAGSAPAEVRAAIAVFVGPPDDDVLARVSGPGLVISPVSSDPGFSDAEMIGRGSWRGCFVHVNRLKASDPLLSYYGLTAEQVTAFRAGRLSALNVAVGCGGG